MLDSRRKTFTSSGGRLLQSSKPIPGIYGYFINNKSGCVISSLNLVLPFSIFWLLSFQDYEGTIELLDLMDPPWGTSFPKDWIWKYQNGKYLDPYEGVFMIFLHSLKSKFTTGTIIEMRFLFAIHWNNHVRRSKLFKCYI